MKIQEKKFKVDETIEKEAKVNPLLIKQKEYLELPQEVFLHLDKFKKEIEDKETKEALGVSQRLDKNRTDIHHVSFPHIYKDAEKDK